MIDISDLIGVSYLDCGRDKNGYDCYGLVLEIYKRLGINLPDFVYDNLDTETKIEVYNKAINGIKNVKLDKPKSYCLILIEVKGLPTHIGVYLDNGNFIHATRDNGVVIDKILRWENRIGGYYEVCNS